MAEGGDLNLRRAFTLAGFQADQSVIEDTVKINHTWVQGSYWNPNELPNWGFLVMCKKTLCLVL